MKINFDKVEIDESRSNPMVAAMRYECCQIGEICLYMAVGGAIVEQCKYFTPDGNNAICGVTPN